MKASRSVKKDLDVGVEKLGAVVLWGKPQEQTPGTPRCESLGTIPTGRAWAEAKRADWVVCVRELGVACWFPES